MSLPNLLIIGAMKAGTSSLHNYLSQHPDIFMSEIKELNFFNTSLNWNKGLDWYKVQFDPAFKIRGEASPNYSKWEGTAERIHGILPNAKLVYILRDPVKRFVSQCNHSQEDPNQIVSDLKKGKTHEVFTNGLYSKWYAEYLRFFPKSQMLLITSEDLRHNEKQVLSTIFDFLDVDAEKFDFDNQKLKDDRNVTDEKMMASYTVQSLNENRTFRSFKKTGAPLIPVLKPVWNKILYRKRTIRFLSLENENYIKQAYKDDAEQLKQLSGRLFYYG